MSQQTKKSLKVLTLVLSVFIVIFAVAVFLFASNADEGDTFTIYGDGTMKAGEYYLDGNTEGYYFEVFEDKTIQLKGGDPLEFILEYNKDLIIEDPEDEDYDLFWDSVNSDAEWYGSKQDYVVVNVNFPTEGSPHVAIFFQKSAEEVESNGGGTALSYVDEKTFELSPFTFTRVD